MTVAGPSGPAKRAARAMPGPVGFSWGPAGWPGTYQSRAYSQAFPVMSRRP
jgi:hypothetical protein